MHDFCWKSRHKFCRDAIVMRKYESKGRSQKVAFHIFAGGQVVMCSRFFSSKIRGNFPNFSPSFVRPWTSINLMGAKIESIYIKPLVIDRLFGLGISECYSYISVYMKYKNCMKNG